MQVILATEQLIKIINFRIAEYDQFTFNSAANDLNMFSIFVLSFADVSMTNKISGMHSHMASASLKSTSLSSSKSHLLPTKISATFDVVYRRTSSIQRCMLKNEARFVISYTMQWIVY